MSKKRVEEVIEDLVLPILDKLLFELVDIEYVKEGSNWFLRIFIDKPEGITIDNCQSVSEELNLKIDEADPIKGNYYLEVSSPGIERALKKEKDFERFKDNLVEVKLFKAKDSKKLFKGNLVGLIDGSIVIKEDNNTILKFDKTTVSSVKKVIS